MNGKVIDTVERKNKRIRTHIKQELVKLEPELGIKGIPAKFLLLPTLEVEWRRTWERQTKKIRAYMLPKKNLLALTILHPPIHNIVREMRLDNLRKLEAIKGMGAVAKEIISEWRRQGEPREGPIHVGETLIVLENRGAPLTLRIISGEKTRKYLVTKVAKTKEIRWENLTIPAIKPRIKKKGN